MWRREEERKRENVNFEFSRALRVSRPSPLFSLSRAACAWGRWGEARARKYVYLHHDLHHVCKEIGQEGEQKGAGFENRQSCMDKSVPPLSARFATRHS